ncbi:hypothetical protein V1477_016511 [Vespula maculifrons]|uniref:Uncharacterized protein n=1 Tax=Vespula maculifrons TaxID=7453 RepID=A0ABD2B9C8_VESMC
MVSSYLDAIASESRSNSLGSNANSTAPSFSVLASDVVPLIPRRAAITEGGVSPPSISLSIFFFLNSIVSGVSNPAGIDVIPLGVISPSAPGVTNPLASPSPSFPSASPSPPSSASSSSSSSPDDSDSGSPHMPLSTSSSRASPPGVRDTPKTSPYKGLPVSSTGGFPQPPA